jgi:hypothetical protein
VQVVVDSRGNEVFQSRVAHMILGFRQSRIPTTQSPQGLVAALAVWVTAAVSLAAEPNHPAEAEHWAFRPVVRGEVPVVRQAHQVRSPVDAFLLQRLEARQLQFAPEATRREQIRRLKFDLTGLPPTPAEIAEYLHDPAPDAYEQLVERLLASPQYGEHWGRFWLDVVRYAETSGFNADPVRPLAWKYRDWVIQALNRDLPFNTFVEQQIAGDELFPDDAQALLATGYILMWPDESNASNILQARQESLNDLTGNVAAVFLGVSLGCAQCHDHKFDPIPQRDFYRFQAFFSGLVRCDSATVAPLPQLVAWQQQYDQWLTDSQPTRLELQRIEAEARVKAAGDRRMKFPAEVLAAIDTPPELRTTVQRQLAFWGERQMGITEEGIHSNLSAEEKGRRKELLAQMENWRKRLPPPPAEVQGMVAGEVDCTPPPTHRLAAGSYNKPLEEVQPGFPSFVATGSTADLVATPPHAKSSGRRSGLARWLSDAANPLVPRVIVNRVWQQHFGRGLVDNGNDFGRQSSPPLQPELLDWLAAQFVTPESRVVAGQSGLGWSLKNLHRLLLNSTAYRQGGVDRVPAEQLSVALEADESNQGYWHFGRRRLSAESVRDSLLAVSGDLNVTQLGPSVWPELPQGFNTREAWKVSPSKADRNRRSVYIHAKRNLPYPLLEAFDLPDMHESCARRSQTTVAPQALMLLNSELVLRLARQLAGELLLDNPEADSVRVIGELYPRALGRSPDADELPAAISFLDRQTLLLAERGRTGAPLLLPQGMPKFLDPARASAVVDLCHALLNSNEFLYVD